MVDGLAGYLWLIIAMLALALMAVTVVKQRAAQSEFLAIMRELLRITERMVERANGRTRHICGDEKNDQHHGGDS